MVYAEQRVRFTRGFSALQRAEIAEILTERPTTFIRPSFSALQRAEIAEIWLTRWRWRWSNEVSVLFNEPKLLKSTRASSVRSAQRRFQCSSTSRNC